MSDILQYREGGVLTLTLNRLERKNALTVSMYESLTQALQQASINPDIKACVLQGHETVFSAGNDLQEFLHPGQQPGPDSAVMVLLRTVAAFDKPLMACVCGPAVGIGTTLLLHCDLVVAGDNAMFALPFINLGVCPEAASSLLLPQRIGMARAAELLMLGEPFGAQSAEEWGLINRVAPPTEASTVAALMARKLAEKPLDSLMTTKKLLRQTQQAAVMQHLHTEMEEFARLLKAPAAREAMQAFLEKRKPNFSSL